ncbi:MAG TPA: hypothetical protein VLD39_10665 [Gammaproteobacteria bacterium]|nr:hypothetical protein [Gammaproteobacteria bacterium]
MSNDKKTGGRRPSIDLVLNGKILRRREQQVGALDPYDTRRTFEAVQEPREIFRRRHENGSEAPREQQKRIKFEIVDDPSGPNKGGYDPYDAS